jgi:hypothetical protein
VSSNLASPSRNRDGRSASEKQEGQRRQNGVKRAISILAMDITNFGFHGVPSQRQKAR